VNGELKSEERETHWRHEIRTALHVPKEAPSLDPIIHSAFSPTEGVRVERVSYGTQFGMRIPGILYLPDPMPEEKIPGLIVVNGHGGDKYAWYAFYSGMLYAKGGAAVLTYDPTGEGERNVNRES
jgi:dipeptidyl aminopeptidase/acylaminoacyl peptidase